MVLFVPLYTLFRLITQLRIDQGFDLLTFKEQNIFFMVERNIWISVQLQILYIRKRIIVFDTVHSSINIVLF